MSEYTVNWTIEVEADSYEDAVLQAYEIMLDKDSEATCFQVIKSKDIILHEDWKDFDAKTLKNE